MDQCYFSLDEKVTPKKLRGRPKNQGAAPAGGQEIKLGPLPQGLEQ
jgi:hypothetical protein